MTPPETLTAFAAANDAAAATTKKLEKQAAIAAYLRELADNDDLRRAVRFAGGRAFATSDERTIGVSSATMADVAVALLNVDPETYREATRTEGEVGQALAKLWQPRDVEDDLTLERVAVAFDALAETGQFEEKRKIVTDLLARCATDREAAYVGKVIFGDLRTGVRDGNLLAAVAEAFGRDEAEVRRAHLLIGDLDEVAVLAKHDRLDEAKFRLFHPIQFMLASPADTPEDAAARVEKEGAGEWVAESKLDGIRAQAHRTDGRFAMYTRTLDRTDESFPDVADVLKGVRGGGEWLLDGEILPMKDGRVLPFASIQKRLGRKVLTPKLLREHPCVYVAFDCLYREGALLLDAPWSERRAVLEDLHAKSGGAFLLGDQRPVGNLADIEAAFADARAARNEGLILKQIDSPYSPGRRGLSWLKLKTHLPTIDCVVTAAEHGHGKRRKHLSDYTFAVRDGERLVNVGKAFSGVKDEEIEKLTELFLSIQTGKFGRVYTVEPKLVLEIACDQIQKSARHASGYALRFPRIKAVRWDKPAEQADTLARVAELYEHPDNHGRVDEPEPVAEPTLFD